MWFFFFKQKTAYEMRISDWSSDVCSSDLHRVLTPPKKMPPVWGVRANADFPILHSLTEPEKEAAPDDAPFTDSRLPARRLLAGCGALQLRRNDTTKKRQASGGDGRNNGQAEEGRGERV